MKNLLISLTIGASFISLSSCTDNYADELSVSLAYIEANPVALISYRKSLGTTNDSKFKYHVNGKIYHQYISIDTPEYDRLMSVWKVRYYLNRDGEEALR